MAIDEEIEGPRFLGTQYGALATEEKPRSYRPFTVRGVTLDDGLTISQFNKRRQLAEDVDNAFRGFEDLDDQVVGLNRFSRRAFQIISSRRSREAFDLSRERPEVVNRFGGHEAGPSMLLACRLIAAGVRFVTVIGNCWDTHADNFKELKRTLLPRFDQALTAMFETLQSRDPFDSTSILVTGEFGRTPKVNGRAGRDALRGTRDAFKPLSVDESA